MKLPIVKIPLLLLLAVAFTSCDTLKSIRYVNEIRLRHHHLASDDKDVRFLGMHYIGQGQFYDNVQQYLQEAGEAGYVVFYEEVDIDTQPDSVLRKFRKMVGFLPTRDGYESLSSKLAGAGLVAQNNAALLSAVEDDMVRADVTARQLVAAYEARFGPIDLREADFTTQLDMPVNEKLPRDNVTHIILNYRNEQLAERIQESDEDKILVMYGEKHFDGLFTELKERDPSFAMVKIRRNRGDDSLLNRPVYGVYPVVKQDGYVESVRNSVGFMISQDTDVEHFKVNGQTLRPKSCPMRKV